MGKRSMFYGLGGLGLLYGAACALLYCIQNRFIFVPSAQINTTPAQFGLTFEEVWLPMQPAGRLHGWWIPKLQTGRSRKPSLQLTPVVAQTQSLAIGQPVTSMQALLYLHGNGENIGANAAHASRLHQLGLSVFLFDYRGYGKSEGSFPSEQAVYADADRALRYLTQNQQIPLEKIVLYGHSLGGAIAIDLARRNPTVGGLIVESSFTSAREMAIRNWWTAIFPVDLLLTQRFQSIDKVAALRMPTLFIHGKADDLIPFQMSDRLFQATQARKQLWLVPGADHTNVAEISGKRYLATVGQFLRGR
jgi:fermentation-respiration switch protein FrsA (DUF1100 family)